MFNDELKTSKIKNQKPVYPFNATKMLSHVSDGLHPLHGTKYDRKVSFKTED